MINNHTFIMLVSCILSGLLSTMNMWVYDLSDIRFSANDVYMIGIMSGFMFFFSGLFMARVDYVLWGLCAALIFFVCIRLQLFVSETEYLRGMIPHHSMAIHMSKAIQKKRNNISALTNSIIKSQYDEIQIMKDFLSY
jgi:hypothetical protein